MIDIKNHLLLKCENKIEDAERRLKEWDFDNKGSSQCYDFWRQKGGKVPWFKEVWKNGSTPKHAFTLWLGIKGKLLTSDKICRGNDDHNCAFCKNETETINHVFFSCSFSSQVWDSIGKWLGIERSMSTLKAAAKWLHKEVKGNGIGVVGKRVGLATTVFFLWHIRNKMRFEHKAIETKELIEVIERHTY
ncbi:uncharacterized protein LOC131143512 [Malania oleifera]|uniref:uncharacterized protein LOC131143512 n=1 Tax=Malania oleifera TaxID=397392 RepID=UPI0025ADFCF7|nr:uncharacterized protein LOC131143512 [Malania oleifera]